LILDAIGHAALEQDCDVLVHLAILLLERRDGDDDSRLDLAQVHEHLAELASNRPSPGGWFGFGD
jgi:hypothetical protein